MARLIAIRDMQAVPYVHDGICAVIVWLIATGLTKAVLIMLARFRSVEAVPPGFDYDYDYDDDDEPFGTARVADVERMPARRRD